MNDNNVVNHLLQTKRLIVFHQKRSRLFRNCQSKLIAFKRAEITPA